MADFKPQTENLFRGCPGGARLLAPTRDDEMAPEGDTGGGGTSEVSGSTIFGHFAVFNEWTEISSWYEGEFLERLLPGSFTNTFKQHRDQVKVQFDHGYDEFVGGAPLGAIDTLEEDEVGAYYEVALFDTDYNRDRILPLTQGRTMDGEMKGSALGASFRFRIVKDAWNMDPGISAWNPKGLPERTISQVTLFEFGPVVWPAYASATAMASTSGARSLTDHFLDRLRARSSKFDGVASQHSAENPVQSPPALDGTPRSASAVARRAQALQALRVA